MSRKRQAYWRNLLGFLYSVLVIASLIALFFVSAKDLGQTDPNSTKYADFVGYYRCGKIVLSADREKIYDREIQLKYFNSLQAVQTSKEAIFSQYPPFFFVMLAPFALLPMKMSFTLWTLLSMLALVGSTSLLMKKIAGERFRYSAIYGVAGLVSAAGWICICVGQLSCFITSFTALFVCGLMFGCDILIGLSLALISIKLQYLVFLIAPLLAHQRWRAILWAAAIEAALLAVSGLVVGAQNLVEYPMTLFVAETTKDYSGVFPEYMISIRGLLSLLLNRHDALVVNTWVVFGSIIPLVWLWKRVKPDSKQSTAWASSVTIILALVLSPHTHIYDDVLLVLPAALTLPLIWSEETAAEGFSTPTAAKIWRWLLLAFPWLSWAVLIGCNGFDMIKRTPFALINLVLAICGMICLFRAVKAQNTVEGSGTAGASRS